MKPVAALLLLLALQDPPAPRPEDPESPVHPRKFGTPGGIGVTRGWYVWRAWHPETGLADVSNEQSGEAFTVRVLPWATTYRHLAYGAAPDDLLPGERVNLFFNPEGSVKRAYLVHFQDEVGQMKGHNHAWRIDEVAAGGRGFVARVMHGDKLFDPNPGRFELDPACRIWRDGKIVDQPGLTQDERLFLTWCTDGTRRVVRMMADAASLNAIQAEGQKRVQERVAREGMGGFVESVGDGKAQILIFATWWAQAAGLKPGQTIRLQTSASDGVDAKIVSRKNLGTYGSGPSEIVLEDLPAPKAALLKGWSGGKVVRVLVRE
ncbi:MAG: hypothetical protein HY293_18615 [Planctomycetes bacterium]|nr:hypothetical protein [Planctomycetota bacterium]